MSEQILALNPNQPRARLLHGAALTSLGRQTEARAELKQLLKEFPQSPEVQMQLGIVAVSEKKYREAEQVFGKSQQRGASDPLAAVGLAETYSAQKQYDRAIQLLQGELKKSPGSPTIGRLLAYTAARAGNYNVAIGAYQSLLEGNPKQPELYLSLAEAYFAKQDYEHSIQALNSAKNLAPKDGRVDMLLAAALRESGRAAEAKPYLEHVLEAQPNNPVALNNMAFYMAENGGNLDKALELAQRAVRQSPGEPSFSDTLGWIYTKKNMHIAAVQIFTNLLKKQPNDPTIRYHLGVALMGKGDHEGARIELQTALSKAPAKDEEQKIRALLAKLD